MATLPKTAAPKREGDHILLTMPNYWGKGAQLADARAQLKSAGGRPKNYWRIHSVHPDTYVNEFGQIVQPSDHLAMVIEESNPQPR